MIFHIKMNEDIIYPYWFTEDAGRDPLSPRDSCIKIKIRMDGWDTYGGGNALSEPMLSVGKWGEISAYCGAGGLVQALGVRVVR